MVDIEVHEDLNHPGDWRVEYPVEDGLSEIAIFIGPEAAIKARLYKDFVTEYVKTHTGPNLTMLCMCVRQDFLDEYNEYLDAGGVTVSLSAYSEE